MANFIPAIESYATKGVDDIFVRDSIIKRWFDTPNKYVNFNFSETGAVKVMDILTDGLSDYYKANHAAVANSASYAHDNQNNGAGARDGLQRGNVQSRWTTYYLTHLRGKQLPVDWVDDEQAAGLILGNTLNQFVSVAYVPEFDEVGFSTLAAQAYATFGNLATEDIAANAIISKLNAGLQFLTELSVPQDDIAFFVNPSVMTLIKQTNELTHFCTQADFTSKGGITFHLYAYNGHPIIEVPSDRFFTLPQISDGCYPSSTSKVINFIACSLKAMVPVVKLEWTKIYGNEVITDFRGWLIDFLSYYDFIIPRNKIPAVYVSVSSSGAATAFNGVLRLGLIAGSATGTTLLKVAMSSPAGRAGNIVYSATAFTLGSDVTVDGANVVYVPTGTQGEWVQYAPVSTAVSSGKSYFALVDGAGKAIAVSTQITLPLGA